MRDSHAPDYNQLLVRTEDRTVRGGVPVRATARAMDFLGVAQGLVLKGKPEKAIGFLNRVNELKLPDVGLSNSVAGRANLLLGDIFRDSGRMGRALASYDEAARRLVLNDEMIEEAQRAQEAAEAIRDSDPMLAGAILQRPATGRALSTPGRGFGCAAAHTIQGFLDHSSDDHNGLVRFKGAGTIDTPQDDEWWAFQLGRDRFITIETTPCVTQRGQPGYNPRCTAPTNPPPGDDTFLGLYLGCNGDAGDILYGEDEDSGEGLFAKIETCLTAGEYFVEVTGFFDAFPVGGFGITIKSGDRCEGLDFDEFEPDLDPNAPDPIETIPVVGCPTLIAEDEEDEDEEDESDSEEEASEWNWGWGHHGHGEEEPPPPPPPTVCEILQTQCRTIFPAGDLDFARFNSGEEARMVRVETRSSDACNNGPGAADEDTVVGIYSEAAGFTLPIVENDDKGAGSLGSRAEFCAPANTDLIIKVEGARAVDRFFYELEVDATVPCTAEVEPDADCLTATDLGDVGNLSVVRVSGLHNPVFDEGMNDFISDFDYYRINLPDACRVQVQTIGDAITADTQLRVFNSCPVGAPIFSNDDRSGTNNTSFVSATLQIGTYYIEVTESQAFCGGVDPCGPFPYEIEVFCSQTLTFEVEPTNNNPNTPTLMKLDQPVIAALSSTTGAQPPNIRDRADHFLLQLTADTLVECNTQGTVPPNAAGRDTVMQIATASSEPVPLKVMSCTDDLLLTPIVGTIPGSNYWSWERGCMPPGNYIVSVRDWACNFASGSSCAAIPNYELRCFNRGPCSADPDPFMVAWDGDAANGYYPFAAATCPFGSGNSVCTAAGVPQPCCTGAGTGTCLAVTP